jgi:multidrug efflux system membrane fusion protein
LIRLALPLAAIAAILLAGCGGAKTASAPQAPPHLVIAAKVVAHDAPVYLDEIGACTALATVQIQAQVSGQIIERKFADGADVKKGDVLFLIDPAPYKAALDEAKGALAQNHAQLDLDQINLTRAIDLRKKNVNTQQDLDTAKTTVETDQAKIQSAEASVAAAQVNLNYCTITSPIDGRAGLRQVDTGNIVTAGSGGASGSGSSGSTVLLTIQQLDPIYTDFTIAETDLGQVRHYLDTGKIKVETDAPDDTAPPRTGDLYFIDNAVAPTAGTVKARAITPNPDRLLWPGEFVHARLILDTIKNAKLIPNDAVQISQQGEFVFVVKADSTVEMRTVKVGQRQGSLVVIEDGLNPGEEVVVTGQLALAPGAHVSVQPAASPAPGGGMSAKG